METSLSDNKEFWEKEESTLLLNPRFPLEERRRLASAVEKFKGKNIVWLRSSGTESSGQGIKLVALKKSAILKAAGSVNQFFGLSENDVWLCGLPIFHVGGLSIYARAFLSKSKVIKLDQWNVDQFQKSLKQNKVTVCSLVPTQVFDLVNKSLKAPSELKLVIVGGGALSLDLLEKATKLGWPLALSYGMTETSALIAATDPKNIKTGQASKMELLPHVELHPAAEKWAIESDALFTAYLWVSESDEKYEPRPEPFILDDRLKVAGREIEVLGRESEIIKVLGETVNLNELREKISHHFDKSFFLNAKKQDRKGYEIELIVEGSSSEFSLELGEINKTLMPYEEISSIQNVERFLRTSLGKINKPETLKKLKLTK